jgi:hypothetical protein
MEPVADQWLYRLSLSEWRGWSPFLGKRLHERAFEPSFAPQFDFDIRHDRNTGKSEKAKKKGVFRKIGHGRLLSLKRHCTVTVSQLKSLIGLEETLWGAPLHSFGGSKPDPNRMPIGRIQVMALINGWSTNSENNE